MGRKPFCLVLCFLFLLITLYFYIPFNRNSRNSNNLYNHFVDEIPTVLAFQNDQNLEVQNCTSTFDLDKISVDLQGKKWLKVGLKSKWYIYSAYTDNRLESSLLRILALSKDDAVEKLFCRIWYNSTTSALVETQKQELWIPAWHSTKRGEYYHPYLLTCPTLQDPLAVSVVENACDRPLHLIDVTLPNVGEDAGARNFVICLKPLNFDQDTSFRILEWLELQFLLGVDNVFAYIRNTHPHILKVLKYYEKHKKVSIKTFKPPEEEESSQPLLRNPTEKLWQKRRYEILIYNDCFYRHIRSHKYTVNMDLDEAIVPVTQYSWLEMLNNASAENPRLLNSASMSVANVYFFDAFGKISDNDSSVPSFMHMLQHVYRSSNFTPPGFAQKSIFSTNLTLAVSNHFALQALRPGAFVLSAVDQHHAHLHHYRKDCPPLMEEDCEQNYIKYRKLDITLWRYKNKLTECVQTKVRDIGLVSTK